MDAGALLDAMASKMRWHQARQSILAQNVANANTPGYRGEELQPISFGDALSQAQAASVQLATNDPSDFGGLDSSAEGDGLSAEPQLNFEVTPEGNGVTIEDEMMKVTANQMDYQTVTTLYAKSLALIRTALGHPS